MAIRMTTLIRPSEADGADDADVAVEIGERDTKDALTDFTAFEIALDACVRRGRAVAVEELNLRGGGPS